MGVSSHGNTGTLGTGDQVGTSQVGIEAKEWEAEFHPFKRKCHRTQRQGQLSPVLPPRTLSAGDGKAQAKAAAPAAAHYRLPLALEVDFFLPKEHIA